MGKEVEPFDDSISYIDTLVPVEFVLPDGTVKRLRLPPKEARDRVWMSTVAESFKLSSSGEVVVHVGYSNCEGGMPEIPVGPDYPIEQ